MMGSASTALGMKGSTTSVSSSGGKSSTPHLQRYLWEFDKRWTARRIEDGERARQVIEAAPGRRLTYAEVVE